MYAVRYATLRNFPVSALVQGAEPKRKLDIAMTFWVLKGSDGRTVLVDAGFYRPRLLKQWSGIADYTRPDKALARLAISPEQVTDDKHVAIAQTLDAKSNLAAQDRMKRLATSPRLIVPGHDPEVFVRFPMPGNGVARVE